MFSFELVVLHSLDQMKMSTSDISFVINKQKLFLLGINLSHSNVNSSLSVISCERSLGFNVLSIVQIPHARLDNQHHDCSCFYHHWGVLL